ncbi:MAG: hypothetical protein PHT54_04565 [Candidatus Nanoarchaeia archaeon]|nr:hypothetical protein [Candidatus Nanoarchaeia archaeon]
MKGVDPQWELKEFFESIFRKIGAICSWIDIIAIIILVILIVVIFIFRKKIWKFIKKLPFTTFTTVCAVMLVALSNSNIFSDQFETKVDPRYILPLSALLILLGLMFDLIKKK